MAATNKMHIASNTGTHRQPFGLLGADSEGWRSAFRTDVDHNSEVMPISVPI
jgi:hypothetical protein